LPEPEAKCAVGGQPEQVLTLLACDRRGVRRKLGRLEPGLERSSGCAAQGGLARDADRVVDAVELRGGIRVSAERSRLSEQDTVAVGARRRAEFVDGHRAARL